MNKYGIERRCAEAIAREAGRRIEAGRRAGVRVDTKATNDLVTNVDRDVERFIRDEIERLFPDDGLWGEEYGRERSAASDRVWLIDPIDGTTNFSHEIPLYCVSIALQQGDQSVVGVVYEPGRDELFSAERARGATLNGRALGVSRTESIEDAIVATGFPPTERGASYDEAVRLLGEVMKRSRAIRRMGSAAIDLAYVAAGRLDAYWEYHLHAWDTAAGYLLVEEAGGRVSRADGGAFRVEAPSIVATNGAVHAAVLRSLDWEDRSS